MPKKAKRSVMVIAITGTPCSGKTTLAAALNKSIKGSSLISVNSAIKENKFYTSKDSEGTLVADMGKLGSFLRKSAGKAKGTLILEGHLLCELRIKGATAIVVREHLPTLEKRMKKRGYGVAKTRDNLVSEAIDYCGMRALENYDSVYEIMSGKNALRESRKIINGIQTNKTFIDLLGELAPMIKNNKKLAI